jgi:class 3 adenylate cyclase/serine/threonine protein kinase/DNA-binding winged helix-turn-helix (wHTH) protein
MEGVREGRHLAAIMFVDMVGYSARMQENEPRAISAVRGLWELVRPVLKEHGGREVDLAGDGMLMEFPGALSAVRCALQIHNTLHQQNMGQPEADRILTRAGVHLGDIEHKDGRIYGDGINIAARLLPLSPPGGIVLSPHVRDQVHNVLEQRIEKLGSKTLKNIKIPLEIWCIAGPDCTPASLASARAAAQDEGADRRWHFGNAVLDERTLELTVDGTLAELEKKSLDVLTFLLHHAGEVVTKDEILEAVWPGRVLTETVLTKCISRIREVLRDEDQSAIKTVHGFGYRLAVPVKVEAVAAPSAPHFDFKEGDHPAGRPLWSLARRLGQGGHGEVWLVRHDKTREERVYKFALDPAHLASLKREITLSRILHDTQGARQCFVRVLDWNLEQIPYFIECEYSSGGSLVEWTESQGGLEKVPVEARLDLAAQIAEALAAAHSVGVLHKDLKPSNVLVERQDALKIRLADFGSGGVLDPQRLEELGITRMGFTKTVFDASGSTSGTPIYLAPEVIAGQPFTVQADIYALGVILYQLVVGDFRKTLAPGWEKRIEDELLREDIAAAAAGYPAERLSDAGQVAQHLKNLEQRRGQRTQQRQELERNQRSERMRNELRRLRAVAAVLLLLSTTAIAAGVMAYRARNEAQASAATATAVSQFLTHDVFPNNVEQGARPANISLREILDRASGRIDQRLADQPAAAAEVHEALAESYWWLQRPEPARENYLKALTLNERVYGRAAWPALRNLMQLAGIEEQLNNGQQALAYADEALRHTELEHGRLSIDSLNIRAQRVSLLFNVGAVQRSREEARGLFEDAARIENPPEWLGEAVRGIYTGMLISAGDYEKAEGLIRAALADAIKRAGEEHISTMEPRLMLGAVLTQRGKYEEAESLIAGVDRQFRQWGDADSPMLLPLLEWQAMLRLNQGRPEDSAKILEDMLTQADKAGRGQEQEVGFGGTLLAESYQRLGRLAQAETTMRRALDITKNFHCPVHVLRVYPHAVMADILREGHRDREARQVLDSLPASALHELGERHPHLADFRRVQGLLWLSERQADKGKAALREALDIYEYRFGPDHWRTKRAREELAVIQSG